MTCQVILEFKVKKDSIEKLRSWMRERLPDTRGYDGCISLDVTQNQDEPTSFAIIEQWDSRQHHKTYLQWRTESGSIADLVSMMDGEPSFRFFDYFGV